jgi:uncharacterized membrane protein YecN with MAPEG domain
MSLAIAPFFIGLFAVMQVPITILVGYRRFQTGVPFFDGGDQKLLRRMRAHANFTETVPISLLAMAAAELTGAPHWLLWSGGVVLLVGRLMHFATLMRSEWGIGRAVGIILTLVSMGGFGLLALIGILSLR